LLLRQKINLLVPREFPGRAYISACREFWRHIFSSDQTQSRQKFISLARSFDQQPCSPELHGVIGKLKTIRQRILANTLLLRWTKWIVWMLIALIAVAAVITKLAGALFFIAAVAAVGAASVLVWTWRNRPSRYETARRLDSAAGLHDRVSTAIYLGGLADQNGMIGEQRRDALAHLVKVDPRGFFPLQWPGNARRASVLVLLAAGLFAYRVHHRPPLVSLLQTTAHSQLVQSILSPIVHAMEKDLQRTVALVTMKPEATGEELQRSDAATNSDDLWKTDDQAAGAEEQKDAADAGEGDQPQDQLQAPGNQEGNPSGEARQDSNSQSQEGQSGNESADNKSQEQSEQQGPEGRQSLGQSLMQALKNMMSNSPNQQSNNRAAQKPNGKGTPQSGNSQQPGATESDKRGESRGNSDAKQKATQTASEGAGSQQGSKELRKDQESRPVNAVPDRVALEASGFKEQTRMKVATETGTAHLADRGLSPQQDAVVNGAEQENIPARYRFYVQRYFEHTDNGKH